MGDFHGLCKGLVQAIAPFDPELILAGYYPGTLISHMLQAEIYPVRLSRRVHDVVIPSGWSGPRKQSGSAARGSWMRKDDVFQFHPEYVVALNELGMQPDPSAQTPYNPPKVALPTNPLTLKNKNRGRNSVPV